MARRTSLVLLALFLLASGLVASANSAPTEPTVSFSAAGDFGSSASAAAVLDVIHGLHNDLTVALGDLSYGTTGQEQAWCDFVTPRLGTGYPFELISGNHEGNGQNGNINDFSACLPNQLPGAVGTYGRQWYVDVPAAAPLVRLVLISPSIIYPDGTWSYAAGSPRYTWAQQAIDGARAAGIPWIVVGMHKPCLSVGSYSCEPGPDIMNLLLAKRVDLVLTGHEHLYQRTKQLALRAGCASLIPNTYNPACVTDSDPTMDKGAGTVFATVGTGGQGLYNVNASDTEAQYFAAMSGLNRSPAYGALNFTVTANQLSANFAKAGTGTFTDSFTITKPTNRPPLSAFTSSCNGRTCTFNGSGSSDPDGLISSYAWTFGDGTTGTGPAPSHTFGAAGTYPVALRVTDNGGATGSTMKTVTVAVTVLASDNFSRTVANGFGTAPVGGAWTISSTPSSYAVTGTVGTIQVPAGVGPAAYLPGVASASTDVTVKVSTDKAATGSGLYVSLEGRRTTAGDYRAKLRLQSDATVGLSLQRATSAGVETPLTIESVVPGLTYAIGDVLNLRLQVVGTSPTTLRTRLWKVGSTEPATWSSSATDSTSGWQSAGSIGLLTYLSSSATNGPITVRLDDLSAAGP